MARCDGYRDVVTGKACWCTNAAVWRFELNEPAEDGRLSRLLCVTCEPVFADWCRLHSVGYSRLWIGTGSPPREPAPPVSAVRVIRHSNHPEGWAT